VKVVLAVVDDLIFLSKIEHAAETAGLQLAKARPGDVLRQVAGQSATAILIDLNHHSGTAVDLVRAIKSDPANANTQVIGYLSHVQGDLAAAARAAGCDLVMARSAFVQQLPRLARQLAESAESTVKKAI
jgi:CheY-like chemotaxis protein